MRAEEFYKQRSNSVRELWVLSPKQIEYIALIMEEYAALRIHDVVGRSEQLVCDCVKCKPFHNESTGYRQHKFCVKNKAN